MALLRLESRSEIGLAVVYGGKQWGKVGDWRLLGAVFAPTQRCRTIQVLANALRLSTAHLPHQVFEISTWCHSRVHTCHRWGQVRSPHLFRLTLRTREFAR